jgi:hypothetical protein
VVHRDVKLDNILLEAGALLPPRRPVVDAFGRASVPT